MGFNSAFKGLNLMWFQATIRDLENKYIVQPGDTGVEDHYLLEVEICSVSFSHHPLFSREHILAQRVTELYNKYNHCVVLGRERRLAGRLEALRRARDSLKKALKQTPDASQQQLDRLQRSEGCFSCCKIWILHLSNWCSSIIGRAQLT